MLRSMASAMALAMAPAVACAQQSDEVKKLQQRVDRLEAQSRGQSAFNPEISLILQGTAASLSQDPATYQISGFAPTGGEVAPPRRGFGLAESELTFAGNIDPYFRGQLGTALTPEDEVEVEEAFFQTIALGRGFTLKGGRFLSGIGYQNEIHQHAWDFQDPPLAYKAFLGGRFNDDGVQVRWLAPTDMFLEFGAEAGAGRGFPGSDPNKNGAGAWTLFAHAGGDIWRAGLSYLEASPRDRPLDDTSTFSGDSRLWIADLVAKWTDFKVQGEYFRRRETGDLNVGGAFADAYSSTQSGWYAQAVYRIAPQWRAGYRYDRLDHGTVSSGGVDHDPTRNKLMVDWSPTEFSRLRLQLAQDKSRVGVTDDQILLQYIFSLGAHGAHRF